MCMFFHKFSIFIGHRQFMEKWQRNLLDHIILPYLLCSFVVVSGGLSQKAEFRMFYLLYC